VETPLILQRLYRLPPPRPRRRFLQRVGRRAVQWVQRHTSRLAIGSVIAGAWIVSHLYYYNVLVTQEFNVIAAWAQVEATRQKRDHVQRDLTQLVRYYARYERGVLEQMTTLRTKDKSPAPAPSEQLLGRLDAVAEQYPSLNLDRSVHQFSQVITATESEITERIVAYNAAVNIYTTTLNSFPGIVFGRLLGFRDLQYYKPDDPSALDYREVTP
jgi:LemA protein